MFNLQKLLANLLGKITVKAIIILTVCDTC